MADLYTVFISAAAILFVGIVVYSLIQQQRNGARSARRDYDTPLLAELEQQKKVRKANASNMAVDNALSSESNVGGINKNDDGPSEDDGRSEFDRDDAGLSRAAGAQQSDSDPLEAAATQEKKSVNAAAPDGIASDGIALDGITAQSMPRSIASPKVDAAASIVMELVARVKNPQPIEQQQLLSLFRLYDFKFHRKVHIYGLNQLTDLWRDIEYELPAARFVELGVAIQLADRGGAMSQKELHDFQQMALEFSNKFDAPFEFSMDFDEALKQAQILDQLGRRYDSMAVLNVVPKAKAGFRMADIESCAKDLMMSTDRNGIFVKTKGQKQNLSVLYHLACTDGSGHFGVRGSTIMTVYDLVIYMNVPTIEHPDRVFQAMVKDTNSLATWLDGKVVDRNGKVMTQRSYFTLLEQILDITYSMQQDGLTPGDAVSKKLF